MGEGQTAKGQAGEELSVKEVYATQKVYALTSCFQKKPSPRGFPGTGKSMSRF